MSFQEKEKYFRYDYSYVKQIVCKYIGILLSNEVGLMFNEYFDQTNSVFEWVMLFPYIYGRGEKTVKSHNMQYKCI